MPHLHTKKQGVKNNMANVIFTMFAINSLLSIYIFATYLQGANLCKSIFRPMLVSDSMVLPCEQRIHFHCVMGHVKSSLRRQLFNFLSCKHKICHATHKQN